MKSIFDKQTRDELICRIDAINNESKPGWGKMNTFQMLKHCTNWEEVILGKRKVKRMFLGSLFGKIALKGVLKNDNPLRKNSPTSSELIITETIGDIGLQKKEWIKQVAEYENFNNQNFIHPFFGTMTKDQIGLLVYKHNDHHLTQFGV